MVYALVDQRRAGPDQGKKRFGMVVRLAVLRSNLTLLIVLLDPVKQDNR